MKASKRLMEYAINSNYPIIFLHGLLGFGTEGMICNFSKLKNCIKEENPEQVAISLDYCNYHESLFTPLDEQIFEIKEKITQKIGNAPFYLVGHSQGALLGRCLLEEWDNHNCQSFISLAGPQMGVFGLYQNAILPKEIKKMVEDKIFKEENKELVLKKMTELIYSLKIVKHTSIPDLWRDANSYESYLENNKFLPKYNNEIEICERYKENLCRLKKFSVLGGYSDKIILPQESQFFGFLEKSQGGFTIKEMEEQRIFKDDLFGLKTLKNEGKLKVIKNKKASHVSWLWSKENFKEVLQCI